MIKFKKIGINLYKYGFLLIYKISKMYLKQTKKPTTTTKKKNIKQLINYNKNII